MNEEQFNELLKRYQAGEASSAEMKIIEDWLESRGKNNMYGRLSAGELKSINKKIHRGILQGMKKAEGEDSSWSVHTDSFVARWRMYRIAATVLILIAAGFLVWNSDIIGGKANVLVETSSGGIEKIILDDGSIVWLKGESSLKYPERFGDKERLVELEGEALFEVTKATIEPSLWERWRGEKARRKSFVVKSGSLYTRVLGTSFNVKSDTEETEVYVLTGKVEVRSENGSSVELLPNERSVFESHDQELKKYGEVQTSIDSLRQIPIFKEYTKGTEYNMFFENVELEKVAQKISQKFDVSLEVDDAMASCLIRADFTDQSLKSTLALIAETMNGRYKTQKDQAYLYGPGCE